MISELKNYIANMNTSGNMALNITKATNYLKGQKKQFETQLSPEAARTYTMLLSEIRNIEKEISSPEYENQMQEYVKMRDSVKEEIELNQQEKDELADKVLRGRQMLDDYEFSDEASISAYLNNAEEIYSCYNDSKAVTQSGGGRMVPIILFLLAAAAAAGSGYFLYLSLIHI